MKQRNMGLGIGLIVLGLIFLLGPWLNLAAFGWPFFVIIPGAILLFLAFTTRVGNGSLAVPGAIVTATGLILLVLNITGRMQAWAYAWTLVMAAAGAGSYLYGTIAGSESLKRTGRRGAALGLVLFAAFGLFFELLIFGTFSSVFRWLLPLGLILVGALLLFNAMRAREAQRTAAAAVRPPAPAAPPPSGSSNGPGTQVPTGPVAPPAADRPERRNR